jgi:hypothetical protein
MSLSRRRQDLSTSEQKGSKLLLIHFRGANLLKRGQHSPLPSFDLCKTSQVDDLNDTQTGMPFGIPKGARCVQRFNDSRNSAIHITYRISLRSSSMREPRDPLLKVVFLLQTSAFKYIKVFKM